LPPPLRWQPVRRDLYNQMAFASHSNIRPDNSWIRGPPPPVPPKPQRLTRTSQEMCWSYTRALSPPLVGTYEFKCSYGSVMALISIRNVLMQIVEKFSEYLSRAKEQIIRLKR
jgi:hypothetical protein